MLNGNLLLAALTDNDYETFAAILEPVVFKQHDVLFEARQDVASVYFPSDAVIALGVSLTQGELIEVSLVGRDGVVGASAALDSKKTLNRAVVQIGGHGHRCAPSKLKKVLRENPRMHSIVMRHEQALFAQAQQCAACNAIHDVLSRLARWLLRAQDLKGGNGLPFTQEYLAEMLGVRRSTVNAAAHTLQEAGMIEYTRGHIRIVDAGALKDASCECYEAIKENYAAVLQED